MLIDPTEVSQLNILKSISSNELFVLHVRNGLYPPFNTILNHKLKGKFDLEISFGWIDSTRINFLDSNFKFLLEKWKSYLHISNFDKFPPGYYFFKHGNICAYHPGTIELDKINSTEQGIASLIAVLAGLISGILQKSTVKGFEAFLEFMEAPQALRMYNFFIYILKNDFSYTSQQEQQKVVESELEKAYKFFGISQDATDFEIRKARNQMAKKFHPDVNPSNSEINNRIMGEINAAWTLIVESRNQKTNMQ